MVTAAHTWGGEGTYTLTGGHLPRHVSAPAPHYIQPLFASDELWHDHYRDCLDAPAHIARGGVVACQLSDSIVLFASEPRP